MKRMSSSKRDTSPQSAAAISEIGRKSALVRKSGAPDAQRKSQNADLMGQLNDEWKDRVSPSKGASATAAPAAAAAAAGVAPAAAAPA